MKRIKVGAFFCKCPVFSHKINENRRQSSLDLSPILVYSEWHLLFPCLGSKKDAPSIISQLKKIFQTTFSLQLDDQFAKQRIGPGKPGARVIFRIIFME